MMKNYIDKVSLSSLIERPLRRSVQGSVLYSTTNSYLDTTEYLIL
jgi:hypothetical protein